MLKPVATRIRRGKAARETGVRAEQAVCEHLRHQGLKILKRNYRTRQGEIDIILQEGSILAFVEVKARKRRDFGSAAEAVGPGKQARIIHTASHYLLRHPAQARLQPRFDVLCVDTAVQDLQIDWIKDAFRP